MVGPGRAGGEMSPRIDVGGYKEAGWRFGLGRSDDEGPMASDDVQQTLDRILAALQEVTAHRDESAELLQGYGLGHSIAMSAVISLLIEKGVLGSEEVEDRLLAGASLVEGRPGAETAKQALGHIVHLIRNERKQAN